MKEIPVQDLSLSKTFQTYQKKFKALADDRRLQIMHQITQQREVCVCDLSDTMALPQSKLSYHLKILLEASLIKKETRGTWSYYSLNEEEVNHLLSEELCCLFRHD
ncbi:ArsR/SmtB family transcription factor [Halobacillus trueperi]|uniref:ArsR/SmtB family transcription factor n=1 Tax=Halobacillus trueperi TaxID=156205 RepID=UPI0037362004